MTTYFAPFRFTLHAVTALLAITNCLPGVAAPPATGPADRVDASTTAGAATLENVRLRVTYDLRRGTYDVIDKAIGRPAITDAVGRVGDWACTDAGRTHSAETRPVRDELGSGQRLLVTSRKPGVPALLLELTLYDGGDFVAFRGGLDNVTGQPVRVKGYHPLADGAVFAGGGWSDVRTLDGMSSAHQSRVSRNALLSSANNLLLTFEQDGARRSVVLGAQDRTVHEVDAHPRPRRDERPRD